MYDELVKRLRNHNGWALNKTLDAAADAIEKLQQNIEQYKLYLQDAINDLHSAHEKEPKWIPVTERLPEDGQWVLVWESGRFAYVDKMHNGKWMIADSNYAIIYYWMPLPEPPKGEKE